MIEQQIRHAPDEVWAGQSLEKARPEFLLAHYRRAASICALVRLVILKHQNSHPFQQLGRGRGDECARECGYQKWVRCHPTIAAPAKTARCGTSLGKGRPSFLAKHYFIAVVRCKAEIALDRDPFPEFDCASLLETWLSGITQSGTQVMESWLVNNSSRAAQTGPPKPFIRFLRSPTAMRRRKMPRRGPPVIGNAAGAIKLSTLNSQLLKMPMPARVRRG